MTPDVISGVKGAARDFMVSLATRRDVAVQSLRQHQAKPKIVVASGWTENKAKGRFSNDGVPSPPTTTTQDSATGAIPSCDPFDYMAAKVGESQ